MPIPTWTSLQVLPSDDINQWFVPLAAFKAADQSVTSSTTLVNDTVLFVTPRINCTYYMECYLDYEGGTLGASDFKWQFTVPGAAALKFTYQCRTTANAVDSGVTLAASTPQSAGTNGAGNLRGLYMYGTLQMSSTTGNLQLQWAQQSINGTSTIVHTGSCLILRRIA